MSDIIKNCKVHGDLTIEQTIRIKKTGEITCRKCRKQEINKKTVSINHDSVKASKLKSFYKNHESNLIKQRNYQNKNKEKLNEYNAKKFIDNPSILRRSKIKRDFGITLDDYEQMKLNQNNLCAICNKPESRKNPKSNRFRNLSIDHCHKSQSEGIMKIRGLLCSKCNFALGLLNENINILKSMIKYIEKYNHIV